MFYIGEKFRRIHSYSIKKLAPSPGSASELTRPISGRRSVGIVHSLNQATEFSFSLASIVTIYE
jgi:hypothetical protein